MHSNDEIIAIQYFSFSNIQYMKKNSFFRIMTQEEIDFYRQEKSKFDQLLERFCWNEEHLFNEVGDLLMKVYENRDAFFSRKH